MSCQYITCRIDCCRGFVADCARSEAAQNLFLPLGVDVHVVLTLLNLGQILAAFPVAPAKACSCHRYNSYREKKNRERDYRVSSGGARFAWMSPPVKYNKRHFLAIFVNYPVGSRGIFPFPARCRYYLPLDLRVKRKEGRVRLDKRKGHQK